MVLWLSTISDCITNNLKLSGVNSNPFIMILDSLGQQFGQDTYRVSVCSLVSGPQLGRLEWLGNSNSWAPFPSWFTHTCIEHIGNGQVGLS